MQAVILAGGLGTRLGALTARIPKPLVPVAGVPYLEHQLRLLARQSIRDVVLLTGYLGQAIEDRFGDGGSLGLSIRYSRELSPLGTGGALRLAAPLIADPFLLIYGDSYLPIDYRAVIAALDRFPATGVVVVYDDREGRTSVRNNIAMNDEGFVIRYDKDSVEDVSGGRTLVRAGLQSRTGSGSEAEASLSESGAEAPRGLKPALQFVEAGVLAFRRSVMDVIPEGIVSLEKDVFPKLIAARQLRAYPTVQRFYDIGTPERLRAIEEFLSAHRT